MGLTGMGDDIYVTPQEAKAAAATANIGGGGGGGVATTGGGSLREAFKAMVDRAVRAGYMSRQEADTFMATIAKQAIDVVYRTAKQLNVSVRTALEGTYIDSTGQMHLYLASRDGNDTHVTVDTATGAASKEAGPPEINVPKGAGDDTGGGGGGSKTTVDDYLNSVPAGVPITAELKNLAAEAKKEQWATWEWEQALQDTHTYEERQSIIYKAQLQSWGMDMSGNINALMQTAIDRSYSMEEFAYWMRQTPEYRQRFKGIFSHGELTMTEDEYIAAEREYQLLGKQYGYRVTPNVVAFNIKKGVDSADFEERLQAVDRLSEYRPALQEFNEAAKRAGLINKNLSEEELYRFVRGEAPASWSKLWEEVTVRTAARAAGIQVGKGKDGPVGQISNRVVKGILKRAPDEISQEELDAGFEEIADNMLNTMPLSKIYGLGLSEGELAQAAFGGPRAATARQKIKRILETDKAFSEEQRASIGVGLGESGGLAVGGAGTQRRGGGY